MPQLRLCGNERIGGFSLSKDRAKYRGSSEDNLKPLKNIDSWDISDNSISTIKTQYYLKNCTFQDIASTIEASLKNNQISALSEILSLIIKEYEE